MNSNELDRQGHRKHDPADPDVTNLGRSGAGGKTRLECTSCKPDRSYTIPVRLPGDSDTFVRCAYCGKKHSTANLTVLPDR